ncbi:MAG: hypothetical protein ABII22_03855 [Candidatus Micrarchaeota archaeon]
MGLKEIYGALLFRYGYQGWWPISESGSSEFSVPSFRYYSKDYSHPKNEKEQFEICIGALLTQNTNWNNVTKALGNLIQDDYLDSEKIIKLEDEKLQQLIKSSGYFRQKSERVKLFSKRWGEVLENSKRMEKMEFREFLLSLKGIGKETADSMMLYAFKIPIFVIDAYTRRFCVHHKLFDSTKLDYDVYRNYFEKNLENDYKLFNEYHALIVRDQKLK